MIETLEHAINFLCSLFCLCNFQAEPNSESDTCEVLSWPFSLVAVCYAYECDRVAAEFFWHPGEEMPCDLSQLLLSVVPQASLYTTARNYEDWLRLTAQVAGDDSLAAYDRAALNTKSLRHLFGDEDLDVLLFLDEIGRVSA